MDYPPTHTQVPGGQEKTERSTAMLTRRCVPIIPLMYQPLYNDCRVTGTLHYLGGSRWKYLLLFTLFP